MTASEMLGFDSVRSNYMVKNLSSETVCKYEISFADTKRAILNAILSIITAEDKGLQIITA